jgi:hypothetical protein
MRFRVPVVGRWLCVILIVAATAAGMCRPFAASAAGDDGQALPNGGTAAGRTLEEWAKEVNSPNRIMRLRAAKMLGVFGADAIPALTTALENPDDGVKYWAASALGDLGPEAKSAAPSLRKIVGVDGIRVGISSAYALCRIGHVDEGMPTLIEGLKGDKATACCAADFLARIGPPAKEALPMLRIASKSRDTHIARASQEAVRRIDRDGGTDGEE